MARNTVEATVRVEGLPALRRALKEVEPQVTQELRGELKQIADRVAREAAGRATASSFGYRGAATAGLRASVQSTGPKGFVARFLEFGFHPGGGSTFVQGRNFVGGTLEQMEERIVDEVGDAIDRAAGDAGWHR